MHLALIVLHTLAATLAFALGCLVVRPPVAVRGWRFRTYAAANVLMVVFVAGAIGVSWPDLATATRLTFLGLLGLGGVILVRIALAAGHPERGVAWVHHVGFSLIALFDGFAIVAALDLGAPAWLAVAIGVAGVLVGRAAVERVARAVAARSIATRSPERRRTPPDANGPAPEEPGEAVGFIM